jgi:uncharacterized membrane protein HdeD (DUF308 family)
MLADVLSHYWWTILLRGVLWILFGIFAFFQPGISLVALTLLFGAFAIADGVTNIVSAVGGRRTNENWWISLLSGLAAVGVGLLTLLSPQVTASVLLLYIAFWAIVTGLFEIVESVRLRREIQGEFWLGLAGVVSVAFGVFLLARPVAGALSVLWVIASYAMLFGMVLVVMAFEVRGFGRALRG